MPKTEDTLLHDRIILFDCRPALLNLRYGEIIIDSMNNVDDTKGNKDKGILSVTNLRIIWQDEDYPKINLSIGFKCIMNITSRPLIKTFRGQSEEVILMTKFESKRYEFIFTYFMSNNTRLFASLIAIRRAYNTTHLYRDMKLRIYLMEEGKVSLLPQEKLHSDTRGVWNLSSDRGNLGVFLQTNIRIIWYCTSVSDCNISLPYVQIKSADILETKFGRALIIRSSKQSGGQLFGFQIHPFNKLDVLLQEVLSYTNAHQLNPNFGVDFKVENNNNKKSNQAEKALSSSFLDHEEIDEAPEQYDVLATYLVGKSNKSQPEFNGDLGLVIGKLQEGYTLSGLWNVIQKN